MISISAEGSGEERNHVRANLTEGRRVLCSPSHCDTCPRERSGILRQKTRVKRSPQLVCVCRRVGTGSEGEGER